MYYIYNNNAIIVVCAIHNSDTKWSQKEKLILQSPSDLVSKFSNFERRVNLILPRSSVMIGPEGRVKKNQSRMAMLTLPSLLIGSIALAVIVYYLLMILDLMIRKNTSHNIMLRNRGMSTKTIIILRCCELIPVVVIPSIVSLLLTQTLLSREVPMILSRFGTSIQARKSER